MKETGINGEWLMRACGAGEDAVGQSDIFVILHITKSFSGILNSLVVRVLERRECFGTFCRS